MKAMLASLSESSERERMERSRQNVLVPRSSVFMELCVSSYPCVCSSSAFACGRLESMTPFGACLCSRQPAAKNAFQRLFFAWSGFVAFTTSLTT